MGKLVLNNSESSNYYKYKKTFIDNKYNCNFMHEKNQYDFSDKLDLSDKYKELDDYFESFYNKSKGYKRGVFIYGKSGTGKSYFVEKYLKEKNYDPIFYEPHEPRNKNNLNLDNISNTRVNVLNMFKKEQRKVVIVVDEIENMNNGDKTGISLLIKSLKIKRSKKKNEENINPVICIGNTNSEKKIKELMDACYLIQFESRSDSEIKQILVEKLLITDSLLNHTTRQIGNNLHRLQVVFDYYKQFGLTCNNASSDNDFDNSNDTIYPIFNINENTKMLVKKLYTNNYSLSDHKKLLNDNDRTIVSLIWHENIPNILNKIKTYSKNGSFVFLLYKNILDNICLGDFMDRIVFQNQIWYLSEYSSILKTFYNNWLLHNKVTRSVIEKGLNDNIDFTKVLTKYSTEYNNIIFLTRLCESLHMDKKDLLSFFCYLIKLKDTEEVVSDSSYSDYSDDNGSENDTLSYSSYNTLIEKLSDYDINKLDINRIIKIIDYVS